MMETASVRNRIRALIALESRSYLSFFPMTLLVLGLGVGALVGGRANPALLLLAIGILGSGLIFELPGTIQLVTLCKTGIEVEAELLAVSDRAWGDGLWREATYRYEYDGSPYLVRRSIGEIAGLFWSPAKRASVLFDPHDPSKAVIIRNEADFDRDRCPSLDCVESHKNS